MYDKCKYEMSHIKYSGCLTMNNDRSMMIKKLYPSCRVKLIKSNYKSLFENKTEYLEMIPGYSAN